MTVKISTGVVRISYANIWAPKETPSGTMKYSCSLLIRKDDKKTLAKISEALKQVKNDSASKEKWGKVIKELHMPIRDGDTDRPGDPNYEDCYFINANANEDRAPKIVDRDRNEILDKSEVYSGCYCQAVITFYPYAASGNKGIGCGLQGLRKIKDGEPLSGSVVTDSDFSDDDIEDDAFGGNSSVDDLF
ncbi:DUF2815 family protein [Megasphaera sueciensis]|uniref:DUF2815 family protein n=1 Tax=Megasphaera sueciensis TaxID=349094 RepID=UPI003CFC89E7